MLIFIADGEATGGTCAKRHSALFLRLADGVDIDAAVLLGLVVEAVGNLSHATAFFLVEQLHAVAHSIHNLHKVFTQLREVVVHIATVEIAHLLAVLRLLSLGVALIPGFEALCAVSRELAVLVNANGAVHQALGKAQSQSLVHDWGKAVCHRAHEVGAGENAVAQAWLVVAVFHAGHLNNVAHLHVLWTCHLAALAVQALFEVFVEEHWIFQTVAFTVGTGLLRAGICWIYCRHWAIYRTN